MLAYGIWVLVSFFAVVGVLGCLIGVIELLSLRKIHSVRSVTLRAVLEGEENRVEYLLNSLTLLADRIHVGTVDTVLEIAGKNLKEETRLQILDYCEKNPWVVFTEE